MKLRNFWLIKSREQILLKIVEWAQKNDLKVETLTKEQVRDAIRLQR